MAILEHARAAGGVGVLDVSSWWKRAAALRWHFVEPCLLPAGRCLDSPAGCSPARSAYRPVASHPSIRRVAGRIAPGCSLDVTGSDGSCTADCDERRELRLSSFSGLITYAPFYL